jgi:hypothetical protein
MNPQENISHFLFGGTCRIADIPFNLSVASADKGLVFAGKLLPGTNLQMENVIKILGNKFNVKADEIPQPIQTLRLTDLGFDYHTDSKAFRFIITGGFVVEETPMAMSVNVTIGNGETTFSGGLTISMSEDKKLNFNVQFCTDKNKDLFTATYHHSGTADISLHNLVTSISQSAGQYIPKSFVIDLQEVEFIFYKQEQQKQTLFGLQLSTGIDLKEIPVVGDKLPNNVTLSLKNLQFLFASYTFTKEQIQTAATLLPAEMMPLPAEGLAKGMHISGELHVMEYIFPINTGNKESKNTQNDLILKQYNEPFVGRANELDYTARPVSPDQITWFSVQKKLGPVSFQRIGVAFADNTLSFALDASLAMGPVQLTMSGLTLGSPLNKFQPVFGLQGFFMSLKTSGFELEGGFLKATTEGVDSYYGTVLAQAGTFSFKAMGGHTPSHEDPQQSGNIIPASFFIYANIEIPIGGPPYFNLKGFAGGFGVNNKLILPTLQELPDYILLPGPKSNAPKQQATPEATVKSVLPEMQKYFMPDSGQYWMAAGVSFSSFQMIEALAVVTVSFGVEFQVALLGSCAMTLPKGTTKPIAYIEIAIVASYTQSNGLLAVVGVVSPASYLLGDFCRLTGGFAFYIWIDPPQKKDGPRAGNFLVSVGGYHPRFTAPDYYPQLPRVGIIFNLSPLQITGEAYFAMTPSMLMAGGRLDAVWKLGIVRAWFKLGIDFIIAWAPFKYYATGYINVGCSVDIGLFSLNASVGANIDIWGPQFGGKAEVDLTVFSFTLYFGGDKEADPPLLTWTEFKTQFLPANTVPKNNNATPAGNTSNILKATVSTGLNNMDACGLDWIIDPDDFVIRISTSIPANELKIGNGKDGSKELSSDLAAYNLSSPPVETKDMPYLVYDKTDAVYDNASLWNPKVHIKPMGENDLASTLDFALRAMDSAGDYTDCTVDLSVRPIVENSAGALWDKYVGNTQINAPMFLKSTLTGFEISPIPRVPSMVNNVPINTLFFKQGNKYRFQYQAPAVDGTYTVTHSLSPDTNILEITMRKGQETLPPISNENYVLKAINEEKTDERRSSILKNLTAIGFDVYPQADLECFGRDTALTDWPEILKLGDTL